MGEGTQMRPGPQLTAAHGDPGLHVPAVCAAVAGWAAEAAGALSAQAVFAMAGDPATTTAARTGASFRSIFPPDVMIGSDSSTMLAPALPANGKLDPSKSDGLSRVGWRRCRIDGIDSFRPFMRPPIRGGLLAAASCRRWLC
ncbi:hypothetical protein AB0F88_37630 [Streptosporangium sp. NPDC023963]|uniref:hypothetical protein n=1 Tax=Streptosporangium sp. NPDC023963 TaxID=3155608 RepID=UPI003418E316